MASTRAMAILIVILRILPISLATGSIVVLVLDKADVDNGTLTFKNLTSYRYVLATAVTAAAYCLLQLPFAIYYACTEKRLIRGDFLPAFDFYADKVIAFLLATGVGAGIFVTYELKDVLGKIFEALEADLKDTPFESFFNKGYVAAGLLAGAFFCMALLSTFSSLRQTTSSTGRGFFFR